jgi:predicted glycosyltransferase
LREGVYLRVRILLGFGHPADVHFFKNVIWELKRKGHEVLIAARDKDVTLALLNAYGFSYWKVSKQGKGILGLFWEYIEHEYALYQLVRRFQPDILTEVGGEFIAPLGRVVARPAVVFTDSEPVPTDKVLVHPFASVICTPRCFRKNLGSKHVRYDGYQELAYLHPNYFAPDHDVLQGLDLGLDEKFVILRFVAWKAFHDWRQKGLSLEMKRRIVKELERYGRVFITSEAELPPEFEPYRVTLPPHKIHHLLYYASLFMGDGATMATEAGILGTPSVRSSTLVGTMGNFDELMYKYELVYSIWDPEEALQKAIALLRDEQAKLNWQDKRARLLQDKIDVTEFVVDILENYPRYIN